MELFIKEYKIMKMIIENIHKCRVIIKNSFKVQIVF